MLVLVGLGIGIVGAAALREVIASQLYGIGAFEPSVMFAVIGVLTIASLCACLGPALKAARVDPVVALQR